MTRLVLLIVLAPPLAAQESMSLPEAVRVAMEKSHAIAGAQASTDAAGARVQVARSGLRPKVNYSEQWTRSDNPVFVFSSLLTQRQFREANFGIDSLNRPRFLNNFQSLVTAEQPLYDAGKTHHAMRAAELTQESTVEETRRQRMEVILQVARSYYATQLGFSQLEVTAQSRKSAEADLERAEARRASGLATDADVLSIRVHLAALAEEEIRQTADLSVAQAAMNDAMGLPLDAPHRLTTALSPLPVPTRDAAALEAEALQQRPEVRQSRLASTLAQVEGDDARASYRPQVSLRGAFEADRQRFINRGGSNWLLALNLRWNLYNGGADKARIAEAAAGMRRTAADQSRTESAIRLQVHRAWAQFKAAQQRIETARASVAEAEESLRIIQNRYAAGLSAVQDLLRVEAALLETRTRLLAAIHDQRLAAMGLELAAGTLQPNSEVLQ